jgi:hypothetical protein
MADATACAGVIGVVSLCPILRPATWLISIGRQWIWLTHQPVRVRGAVVVIWVLVAASLCYAPCRYRYRVSLYSLDIVAGVILRVELLDAPCSVLAAGCWIIVTRSSVLLFGLFVGGMVDNRSLMVCTSNSTLSSVRNFPFRPFCSLLCLACRPAASLQGHQHPLSYVASIA